MNAQILSLFHVDNLSLIMMSLVGFVAICVASFSTRYLKGDTQYKTFFPLLALLVCSVFTMVSADHMLLFIGSWLVSNLLLVRLMIHKKEWKAALNSGILTAKNFFVGFLFLAFGLGILFNITGSYSIQGAISTYNPDESFLYLVASIFLILAAMTQSALWPFHKWLLSSLNSPTPVSALMHAGLVNGGGLLLARFAPLYFKNPELLTVIFVAGMITVIIGTLWKLMQPNIKAMLACSTVSQMGFMIVQCGLGLFPAAIAHLCWHGLFKAYLFLASGAAAQEKRLDLRYPPTLSTFLLSALCGVCGAIAFSIIAEKDIFAGDTTFVLIAVAFIASCQFALTILRKPNFQKFIAGLVLTTIIGGLYGGSVFLFNIILEPLNIMQPQALNIWHGLAMALLGLTWVGIVLGKHAQEKIETPEWLTKLYVQNLNASQPDNKTITASRNDYKYI